MIRRDWNALRVGDRVIVHDHGRLGTLNDGVVVSVVPQREGNEVRVRLPDGFLLYPRRLAVHLRDLPREPCWRCDDAKAPAQRVTR